MRVFIAMATAAVIGFAWLAPSNPADAQTRHVKHRAVRTPIHPYHRPYVGVPPPGYNFGGPNYTTCDRINRDRMLVGTCR